MPGIAIEQDLDLIRLTEEALPKQQWTDLGFELQEYVAFMNLMKRHNRKFMGGKSIGRIIVVDTNHQAKNVGLYEVDDIGVPDVTQQITIPWKHSQTGYAWERKEIAVNRGPEEIVNLVTTRRNAGLGDYAKFEETRAWGTHGADAVDNKKPWGIQDWIVPNSSSDAGFNGGNPASFPNGVGGLSSADQAKWRNWTAVYAAVTDDDLLTKLKQAARNVRFVSPLPFAQKAMRQKAATTHQIYVNQNTLSQMERAMQDLNDNLGKNLLLYMNQITFKGNPVVWVPKLDANVQLDSAGNSGVVLDPIYMVNWATLYWVFQKGRFMVKDGPKQSPLSHETIVTWYNTDENMFCENRRSQAVLYNNTGTALAA